MTYYERADIPLQYELAETFTFCDAYRCSWAIRRRPARVVKRTEDGLGRQVAFDEAVRVAARCPGWLYERARPLARRRSSSTPFGA
jgi:hypothetical protein